jgi:exonuclease 3'-5' domain-containing protein 1
MGSKIARTKGISSLAPLIENSNQSWEGVKKADPKNAALPTRSAECGASSQSTIVIPRQQQSSPSKIWAKFAELEKTKVSSSAQFLDQAALVSHNTTSPHGLSSSGAQPDLEQSRKGTPSANNKQDTAMLRKVSNNTIATVGTVDSKNTLDTKVSTEITQTANPPAECKKAPEIEKYYSVVNEEEALQEFISVIDMVDNYDVDIFVDTEGENGLGKDFNLTCITIKMVSQNRRWLLDPMALGSKLFDTPAKRGKKRTLRQIFEDDKIPVVFFDVRADSNAIHGHFGVHLGGVIDLQVMEMVTRRYRRSTYRDGLDKCIKALPAKYLSDPARVAFIRRKHAGKVVCSGPDGYGVFNQRPLPRVLEEYAINDIEHMPELFIYLSLDCGLCNDRGKMQLTLDVSKEMVDLSTSPEFDSQDPGNKYGPTSLTSLDNYDPYEDDWDLY